MATTSGVLPAVNGSPRSGGEIVAELRRVHTESVAYWSGYSTPEFFARSSPEVWAPADQVRHLTKSMRAINVGFELPRLLLLLRFGIARRASRSYGQFRADYAEALRRGASAGPFAPRALDAEQCTETGRRRVMAEHAAEMERFCRALATWSEASLDRLRLPHPLLGTLTAREMAMFALVHNVHHVQVAERRRVSSR